MVDACERLGLDTQAILKSAGLFQALIADANARIPAEKADALWERAYALADDSLLALHAAEALPFGAYKVIDFLVANAPTVGEGLARVLHYFPIVDPRAKLTIAEQEGAFAITMESDQGELPGPAQEFTFAALVLRSRACSEIAWPLRCVNFTMDAPDEPSEHERIFGCPIRFGQASAQLVVDCETWDLPVRGANAALFGVLEEHAARLLSELPSAQPPSLVDNVKATLREELGGGDVSAAHVAKRLGFGERTLQRRLGEINTTYLEVLAQAREEMACEYLREPGISLTEVAFLLGFAEQSSFTRAFKRWTGSSPGEWRNTGGS